MGRRYVPRLEGLETRQVLDAALPAAAPVPPSAALIGVADSLPPTPAPVPAGDPAVSSLAGNLGSVPPVILVPTAPAAAFLAPAGSLSEVADTPSAATAKPAGVNRTDLPADKKAELLSPGGDLPTPQPASLPTANRREEAAALFLDGLLGKPGFTGLGRGSHRGSWRLVRGSPPPPGVSEAPHPQALAREPLPDGPRLAEPAPAGPDRRATPATAHAARGDAPRPVPTLTASGGFGPGPAAQVRQAAGGGGPLAGRGRPPAGASRGGWVAGLLPPLWLADLLTTEWQLPRAPGPDAGLGQWAVRSLPARGSGENLLPPLYLSMVPLPTGKPLDPVAQGYRYLCNYARTAIHAAERRAGPLSDHEDIVQQICLEWLQQAGPPHEAFPRLLDRSPPEMQLLRETVNRVIARVIYQQRKVRRMTDLVDWPAPARSAERDWVEFRSDCAQGVGRLSPMEWQVLELRRQGKTFAEIGTDLGVARQRVWEVYHAVEARLRKIYAAQDA